MIDSHAARLMQKGTRCQMPQENTTNCHYLEAITMFEWNYSTVYAKIMFNQKNLSDKFFKYNFDCGFHWCRWCPLH